MRYLLAAAGVLSLSIGIAGIFLPLVPTTPLLLLAAALFCRSSPKLYGWLLAHPVFGTYIRNYRENKAIPLKVNYGLQRDNMRKVSSLIEITKVYPRSSMISKTNTKN